jgi:hypothetical protein
MLESDPLFLIKQIKNKIKEIENDLNLILEKTKKKKGEEIQNGKC